jgi:hypothetical protein
MTHAVFACESTNLRSTLEGGLLGGYDGAAAWSLHLMAMRSADEQEMVEHHEGLHHELQASSAWGLTSAMALMLARRGTRPMTLHDTFDVMVEASRQTHECFATVLAATLNGVDEAQELLDGNELYLGYLERALNLVPANEPWELRSAGIAAVLRAAMAPTAVLALLDAGFLKLSPASLDLAIDGPDSRLAAFEQTVTNEGWTAVFDAIRDESPEHWVGGSIGRRAPLPDDPDELAELRRFEEAVVGPFCHRYVRQVFEQAGRATLGHDQQALMAGKLKAAVTAVDAELGNRLQLITERRPILDDALEYDRQRVRLRNRLSVELLTPDETVANVDAFTVHLDGDTSYVCAAWLDERAARKQFEFPIDSVLPDVLICLLVRAATPDGLEVARIGMLPPDSTPRSIQDKVPVPLLVVTTHLTLTHPEPLAVLQRVEPVFVVMDLPVAWHIDDWIAQGATVSFGLTPLAGDLPGNLWLAAFGLDMSGGMRFLSIGGKVGVSLLVERLRQRHTERFVFDGEVIYGDLAGINLAVSHVVGTWHVLDQDGAE